MKKNLGITLASAHLLQHKWGEYSIKVGFKSLLTLIKVDLIEMRITVLERD